MFWVLTAGWQSCSNATWISYRFHLSPSAVWRFDYFTLSVRVCLNLKSKQIFQGAHPRKGNQGQSFAHTLGWNWLGQSWEHGKYQLKTPWFSCLLFIAQLVSNSSFFPFSLSVCSEVGCWLHSLPSSNSSVLLQKRKETRAWIMAWVTDPQHADLLRTGGEKFLSSLWLVGSHNSLERPTETPHLLKLLSIVRSYACKPCLKHERFCLSTHLATFSVGSVAYPAQQCFGPRPLVGHDIGTPQNTRACAKQLRHCMFTSLLTAGSMLLIQDPDAYSGFFGLMPFSFGAIPISHHAD